MPLGLKTKSVPMFSPEAQSAAVLTNEVKAASPSSSDSKPQINDVDRVPAPASNAARTVTFDDSSKSALVGAR